MGSAPADPPPISWHDTELGSFEKEAVIELGKHVI